MSIDKRAVEVLRQIQARGLFVLWSYRAPYPFWDRYDGDPVPREVWNVVEEQLVQYKTKRFFVQTVPSTITRIVETTVPPTEEPFTIKQLSYLQPPMEIHNGVTRLKLVSVIKSDGSERPCYDAPWLTDYKIVSEVVSGGGGHFESATVWHSDYLYCEEVDMDENFEELVGIIERYMLTEAALSLTESEDE